MRNSACGRVLSRCHDACGAQAQPSSARSRLRLRARLADRTAHVPRAGPSQDADGNWRIEVIKRLEKLKSLDGSLIEDEEREQAKAES